MKNIKCALSIAALAMFALGGCATTIDVANPDADGIASTIHQELDRFTQVTIDPEDTRGRLLRSYFLITVFSVYGKASIERYSHSPSGDAGGLLGRIMAAESAVQTALENESRNYYPVDRARLVYSIADLAAKAVRPTTTAAIGLIGTTPANGAQLALGIFRNALENVVYGEAYREGFHRSICSLNGDDRCLPKGKNATGEAAQFVLIKGKADDLGASAWTELEKILESTCDELKQKANLGKNNAFKCGTLVDPKKTAGAGKK